MNKIFCGIGTTISIIAIEAHAWPLLGAAAGFLVAAICVTIEGINPTKEDLK
jgi:hypothetical protein